MTRPGRSRSLLGIVAAATLAATPPPGVAAGVDQSVALANECVRAHAIRYAPGARGEEHAHPHPRVVVVLEGGTLEIREPSGATRTLALAAGDVVWRPAERHAIANPGASTVRLVEIDVLGCAG